MAYIGKDQGVSLCGRNTEVSILICSTSTLASNRNGNTGQWITVVISNPSFNYTLLSPNACRHQKAEKQTDKLSHTFLINWIFKVNAQLTPLIRIIPGCKCCFFARD